MTLQAALHELFLVDQQVRGLESRLDGARSQVKVQQTKIEKLNQQIKEASEQLKQLQAASKSWENEANAVEARIAKLRDQMNTAKTNKEYSAFLVEVNTLKVEKGKHEEKALEVMGQTEKQQALLTDLQAKLAEQQKIKTHADAELEKGTAEVAQRLGEVKAQRDAAAAKVPPEALAIFNKLADDMEGEAMAPVVQDDPRHLEYSCGGCYMSIPAEKYNQLFKFDKLVHCPSCGRILYLEEAMKNTVNQR
jgi:hypothetical protein